MYYAKAKVVVVLLKTGQNMGNLVFNKKKNERRKLLPSIYTH